VCAGCPQLADEAKAPVVVGSERSGLTGDTYRYRDPVKRRAQVAAAMRKRRSRKARRGTRKEQSVEGLNKQGGFVP
jgi:hypothetical protein